MLDSEKLAKRFAVLKSQGISRAQFCQDNRLPDGKPLNPTMVMQNIRGDRPISDDYAIAYANGFGVEVSEISKSSYARLKKMWEACKIKPQENQHTLRQERAAYNVNPAFNAIELVNNFDLESSSKTLLVSVIKSFLNSDAITRKSLASIAIVLSQEAARRNNPTKPPKTTIPKSSEYL